jgi:putative flippase GtrA
MSIAYPLSIITGYGLNTRFTFSIRKFRLKSFIKYVIVYAASFGINWAILSELIDRREFESAVAQLIGTAVVAVFNFLSLKLIVYPNVWRKYD